MTCASFKEQVALLALGALDDAEHAACAEHLTLPIAHDGCREALLAALAGVDSLDDDAPPPRAEVWSAIAERIAPARSLGRARRLNRVGWGAALVCAAAVVVMLLGRRDRDEVALASLRGRLATGEQTTAAAIHDRDACRVRVGELEAQDRLRAEAVGLLELPGTQLFPLAPAKGRAASANAILHTGVKRAYVIADGLTPAHDGDYEMWIARGNRVLPAGTFAVDAHGRAVVAIDYAQLLDGAPDTVMITLEPRGGSSVVRGPTILLGNPRT